MGEKIGKISEIYEDPAAGKPEWATVSSGLFGTKSNFVPLAGASPTGEDVRAEVTKDQVKDAPGVESDGELSDQEEARLFEHYGVPYIHEGSTRRKASPTAARRLKASPMAARRLAGRALIPVARRPMMR